MIVTIRRPTCEPATRRACATCEPRDTRPRAASRVRGPSSNSTSSTAPIDCTSRIVEARNASLRGEQVVERAGALLHLEQPQQPVARDRGEDVLVERRRAQRPVAIDPEQRRGGGLERAAVRGDQQRLVEAALLGQARAEHVGSVGERLDAVEHARGRVGHDAEPHAGRLGCGLLGEQQAPAAARDHDAQHAVEVAAAARREQLRDLALELGPEDLRQAQVRRRALQAVEVLGEREGGAVVDADHLEHAVAAQQALVGGRDRDLARPARSARR